MILLTKEKKMKNLNLSEQAIAEAAYYIWKNNGCPANTSLSDWNAAINQLTNLANTKKSILSSLTSKKTSSCKTTSACKKSTKKCAKKSK